MLLCHGFPELWYSWRHQLPALAAAGYQRRRPGPAGLRATAHRPGAGRGLRHRPPRPDDLLGSARRPRARNAPWSSATTGAPPSPGTWPRRRPERVDGGRRAERAVHGRARRCRPSRCVKAAVRRPVLLHPVLPGAGRRRRRARAPIRRQPCALLLRVSGDSPDVVRRARPPRTPAARRHWMLGRRSSPSTTGRVPAVQDRLHRRPQLVPQLRPQLGAHGGDRPAGKIDVPDDVPGRRAGPGPVVRPRRPDARPGERPARSSFWCPAPGTGSSRSSRPRRTKRCSVSWPAYPRLAELAHGGEVVLDLGVDDHRGRTDHGGEPDQEVLEVVGLAVGAAGGLVEAKLSMIENSLGDSMLS